MSKPKITQPFVTNSMNIPHEIYCTGNIAALEAFLKTKNPIGSNGKPLTADSLRHLQDRLENMKYIEEIPVKIKQNLYHDLFENSKKKVTLKSVAEYLKCNGHITGNDMVSGIDATVKANLRTYHSFQRLLHSETLSEKQVEDIINHAAYSEDKGRMKRYLETNYPALSEEDCKYILGLNLKEFGRLSRRFLTEIYGTQNGGTGEAMSIMDALWETNENLMQLLSERYTFRDCISAFIEEYHSVSEHRKALSERLDDMYISNTVKRQIIRSLDIVSDVVKAEGRAPAKIFIEMARGSTASQKGKRGKCLS